ncbi:MAG: hypothetical protein KBC27_02390 [Rickettsiales bacterium]|nr:hypothetical protein [Rickettsiales bacterium]
MNAHFWEAICLFIFIGLIFKPTKKAVLEYLDSYSAEIKDKILEADNIALEANKTLKYYLKQHKTLKQKVEILQKNTKDNLKELLDASEESLSEKIKQKHKLHRERLEISRQEMQHRVKIDTMAKAIAISTTYIHDNLKHQVTKEDLDFIVNTVSKKKITLH